MSTFQHQHMRYTGMSESRCFRRCHNNNSIHILITSPCAQLTTLCTTLTYPPLDHNNSHISPVNMADYRGPFGVSRQLDGSSGGADSFALTCAQGRNCPHKPISRRPSFAYVFRNFTRTPNFLRAYGNAIETVILCLLKNSGLFFCRQPKKTKDT